MPASAGIYERVSTCCMKGLAPSLQECSLSSINSEGLDMLVGHCLRSDDGGEYLTVGTCSSARPGSESKHRPPAPGLMMVRLLKGPT